MSTSTKVDNGLSMLKVTQIKSRNGSTQPVIATLRSLGLRRIGQTVDVNDTPQARGMIHSVRHLVRVEEDGS
jgi:large subunit ribosomal protein L30